ncbi:MAG: phosphatidylglycerophosphatase A, partial [Pseudomonadota bacterium]
KPGPVGWAEQLEGAGGVLLDDVVAGWLAALVVATLGVLWHAVML